jgi:hypothetical protein
VALVISRWQRRDVKTIQLLPNIRARQMAMDVGADDAIFIGIWVPSILAFGIYLRIINNSKNG